MQNINPISELDEALRVVEGYNGEPAQFQLPLAEDLHDDLGLNLAIITDSALAKGWTPSDVHQEQGYRVYTYA